MRNNEFKEIHEELVILLERFHDICVRNNIRYSLHGGTMLGAIREKGFIPWDDDADITFTREEFEKFKKIYRNSDLGNNIKVDEDSRFPKVIMKREGKVPVWIDLFIYDYISENRIAQKFKLMGTMFFILFTRSKDEQKLSNLNGLYEGSKKWLMNAIVNVAQLFPFSFRLGMANAFMKSFPGKKQLIHRANDQYIGIGCILPKYVMSEYILVPFENTELMVSAFYHEILISSYGTDYMIPKKQKKVDIHGISYENEKDYFIQKYYED